MTTVECATHGEKDACGRTGRCAVCCAIHKVGLRGGPITDAAVSDQADTCRRSTLSRKDVAESIGVAPATLARYNLPTPDAVIGSGARAVRGWRESTIVAWNEARPSRERQNTKEGTS